MILNWFLALKIMCHWSFICKCLFFFYFRTKADEVLNRLEADSSVLELLTFNHSGIITRSTIDTARAQIYRNSVSSLSFIAKNTVKNIDPRDNFKFIRMRTKSTEIIISPEDSLTFLVVQQVSPYEKPYRMVKQTKETSNATSLLESNLKYWSIEVLFGIPWTGIQLNQRTRLNTYNEAFLRKQWTAKSH